MGSGVDCLFELSRIPQLDGIVATSRYDEASVRAEVDAAGPGVAGMGILNFCGWPIVRPFTTPHYKGTIEGSCYENIIGRSDLAAPSDCGHSASTSGSWNLGFVDDNVLLFCAEVDVPYSESTVCSSCDTKVPVAGMPCSRCKLTDVTFGHVHIS